VDKINNKLVIFGKIMLFQIKPSVKIDKFSVLIRVKKPLNEVPKIELPLFNTGPESKSLG
jgi:hypothetical protein